MKGISMAGLLAAAFQGFFERSLFGGFSAYVNPYKRQGTPARRRRVPGPARPAGSKLARKAADGRIGISDIH